MDIICCEKAKEMVRDEKVSIGLDDSLREYYLEVQWVCYNFVYCFWCGKKVSLAEKWQELLLKEHNILSKEPSYVEGDIEIPETFLTDAWWC